MNVHLRIARPTNNIQAIPPFYCEGLGFTVLGHFENHDGFDGLMLGHPGLCYHLEFTHEHGTIVPPAPTDEHLLVFYLPQKDEWQAAVDKLIRLGHQPVPAHNPYWNKKGRTFVDPDGYHIILQNAAGW
ncbi:MAG TPA: VOC family protein [Anaerolineae bacterium]|nr:VOC family protein [Anaerolineae bacterium]